VKVTTLFTPRGLAGVVCALLVAAPAFAQQPEQTQPREHVVRRGDTLWDLARSYLNDPFRWPMIYEANRRIVENPHRIFPAERLIIPGLTQPAEAPRDVVVADATPNRSRFYRPTAAPTQPTVLSTETQRDAIIRPQEWLAAPWISDSVSIGVNGRILNSTDGRNAGDKLAQTFHPFDELYVNAPGNVGDRLLVVRLTRRLRPHGWVVQPMGVLRIDSAGSAAARAVVTHQFADMKVGDMTIPLPAVPTIPTREPRQVAGGAEGRIIDFLDPQPLYGTTDIGFINLGSAQGLQIGDEVVAFMPQRQPDRKKPDVLPEEAMARMRVIKLMSNTATVRITRMHNAALNGDMPVRVSKQQSP
jgi:hypothetical protein